MYQIIRGRANWRMRGIFHSRGPHERWWPISTTARCSKRGAEPHGFILWPGRAAVLAVRRYYGICRGLSQQPCAKEAGRVERPASWGTRPAGSEAETKRELKNAGIADGAGDAHEVDRILGRRGAAQVYLIEGVESLKPELSIDALGDSEILVQPQIDVGETGTPESIPAQVAERTQWIGGEGLWSATIPSGAGGLALSKILGAPPWPPARDRDRRHAEVMR